MPIRRKLIILFLIISLCPMLFVGLIVFTSAKTHIFELELSKLEAIADLKVSKVEEYFSERRGDISTIRKLPVISENLPILSGLISSPQDPAFIKATKRLDPFMQEFRSVYAYEDVTLTDINGIIVYCANKTHTKRDIGNVLPGPNYEKAFEEGLKDVYFGNTFRAETPGAKYELLITAPIRDAENKTIGVVSIEIDMNLVYKFMQDTTGLGATGETLVGKKDNGHVVFLNRLRHDPSSPLKRKVRIGADEAKPIQEATQGRDGYGTSVDYRNKKVIAVWRYIPSMDWGLVAKIDVVEGLKLVTTLRLVLISIVVIVSILVIIAAIIVAKSLSEPIVTLTNTSRLISQGDFSKKITIVTGDELEVLANSFNEMAANLDASAKTDRLKTSELVIAYNKLRDAQTMLIQNEKLASIGQLTSGLAHELNSPLAGILGLVRVLKKQQGQGTEIHSDLEMIQKASEHMAKIIKELSTFSRKSSDEFNELDLHEVIESTLGFSKRLLTNKRIKIIKKYMTAPAKIVGDKLQLQQVFLNMISNASDATSEGGEFVISTVYNTDRSKIRLEFSDNGHGIKEDIMTKLFDPFFTTKPPGKGIGLGLYITHGIIKKHGGEIFAENRKDKGARFTIVLPKAT